MWEVSVNNYWYYLGYDGAMKTGWQLISGKWYYFNDGGMMVANEYIDGYWLDQNGVWSTEV